MTIAGGLLGFIAFSLLQPELGIPIAVAYISGTLFTHSSHAMSSTAPLSGNQRTAFPSIAQDGGIIVGKGKLSYPGGTIIPPTQINVVRPPAVDNTFVRPAFPTTLLPQKQN